MDEDIEASAWSAPREKSTSEVLEETLKKEATIQDVISLQRRLKDLMDKIDTTEKNSAKLSKENEMLQVYERNLTKSATGNGVAYRR